MRLTILQKENFNLLNYKTFLVSTLIIFFINNNKVFSQKNYFSIIQFNVPIGSGIKNPGGLEVSASLINTRDVKEYKATLQGMPAEYLEKKLFILDLTVANRGSNDIIISQWTFRAICPQNNMGAEWQENSFVNLVTPYVPNDINIVLKPGEKKHFFSAENDFFWCLPKDEKTLMIDPRYVTALINCKLDTKAQQTKTTTQNNNQNNKPTNNQSGNQKNKPANNQRNNPPVATKPSNTKPPLDNELLDLIKSFKQAHNSGNTEKADELKKNILAIANSRYPDRLNEINSLIKVPPVSTPKPTNTTSPNTVAKESEGEYSDWLFIQSDKAMQVRYKQVKKEKDIGYFRVQFRINFDDNIHCVHHTCLGYIMTFGYPDMEGKDNIYSHYKFYNSYKQIYTMPDLIPIKLDFPDGSKRFLKKQGFYYTTKSSTYEMPAVYLFYNCVDNIINNDPKHRCSGGYRDIYKESEALILK